MLGIPWRVISIRCKYSTWVDACRGLISILSRQSRWQKVLNVILAFRKIFLEFAIFRWFLLLRWRHQFFAFFLFSVCMPLVLGALFSRHSNSSVAIVISRPSFTMLSFSKLIFLLFYEYRNDANVLIAFLSFFRFLFVFLADSLLLMLMLLLPSLFVCSLIIVTVVVTGAFSFRSKWGILNRRKC